MGGLKLLEDVIGLCTWKVAEKMPDLEACLKRALGIDAGPNYCPEARDAGPADGLEAAS